MGSVLSRGCCLGSGFKWPQAQLCEWKVVTVESLKVIPGPPSLTASCTPWGESLQQGPGTMGFCLTMDLGSDGPRTMGWNLWNSELKSMISLWICLCQVNYNNSGKWLNVVSNRRKCHQMPTVYVAIFPKCPTFMISVGTHRERCCFIRFSSSLPLSVGIPMLPILPYKSTKMDRSRESRQLGPISPLSASSLLYKLNLWYIQPAEQIYGEKYKILIKLKKKTKDLISCQFRETAILT